MEKFEHLLCQCNDHMRATDSKRDRIFYLFVVVFGSFIAFYKEINIDPYVIILTNFFLVVFGIMIVFIIIRYQLWQILYIGTSIVLQKIVIRDIKPEDIDVIKLKELSKEDDTISVFQLGYGASFFIFNSILVMIYLLIIMLILKLAALISIKLNIFYYLSAILLSMAYLGIFNYIYRRQTKKIEMNFPSNSWLLRI